MMRGRPWLIWSASFNPRARVCGRDERQAHPYHRQVVSIRAPACAGAIHAVMAERIQNVFQSARPRVRARYERAK